MLLNVYFFVFFLFPYFRYFSIFSIFRYFQKSFDSCRYSAYVRERKQHGTSPGFFLDVAAYFFTTPSPHLGVRIITSLLELKLEDARLLRLVAYSLYLRNDLQRAKWLFQQVVKLRGEEPQTHRDLGLVHASLEEYQEALNLFWKVIETEWPIRFQHIEDEVLMHLNRTIWKAQKKSIPLDISKVDPRFVKLLPVNLHCTIVWDTDDTCIDLHIIEPNKENCYYSNHLTSIGGWSTPDYSGCPGFSTSMLREYMIKSALPGTYTLGCNYYSNTRQDLTAGTTMWFTVTSNFGTDEEDSKTTTLRLEENSTNPSTQSAYEIGTVTYGVNAFFQQCLVDWGLALPQAPAPQPTASPSSQPAALSSSPPPPVPTSPSAASTDAAPSSTSSPTTVSSSAPSTPQASTTVAASESGKKSGFFSKIKSAFHN